MHFSIRTIRIAASLLVLLASPLLLSADTNPVPAVITADGGRYYGALVEGVRHGHGKIEWPNGARYAGGFDKGLFSGRGKWQSVSGTKYEGDFDGGMMTGQGRMEMTDGAAYEGAFEQDQFHGKGTLTAIDHNYTGEFKRGGYAG